MPEIIFRLGQLAGFPTLALVGYIAYKAGRFSDRIDSIDKRLTRLEDKHYDGQ